MSHSHVLKVEVVGYKGKPLRHKASAHCYIQNLIGDCSSYSVGQTGYCTSNNVTLKTLMQLLAHIIAVQRHFEPDAEPKWKNKFVFSNEATKFNPTSIYKGYSALYHALRDMSQDEKPEHITNVPSWRGEEFQIRTVCLSKSVHHLNNPNINLDDYDIKWYYYSSESSNSPIARTFQSFDTYLKRAEEW